MEDKDQIAVVDLKERKVLAHWPVAPGGSPVGLSIDIAKHRLFVGCRMPQEDVESEVDAYTSRLSTLGGPPAMSAEPIGIGAMVEMADDTGGRAFINTNDLTGAIRQAIDDSSVRYTFGFYITNEAIDGQFHEIKLEVKPKGLIVHYPKGYFAFKDVPSHRKRTAATCSSRCTARSSRPQFLCRSASTGSRNHYRTV